MLTQCPSCHTSFRITSDILRIANGQVRCGRCDTQFDALQSLVEEEALPVDPAQSPPQPESPAQRVPEPPLTAPESDIEVEEPLSEEITLEGSRIEISGVYRTLEQDEPQTQTVVQEFAADAEPEPIEDEISVELDALDFKADPHDKPFEPPEDPFHDSPPIRARDSAVGSPVYPRPRTPLATPAPEFDPLLDEAERERNPGKVYWALLSFFGALLLAAQLTHHYRQDLSRRADVGPYLEKIYGALGIPLQPRWELDAYAVKQWGVVSDPNASAGGTLRVRASIANHAQFPQPYPLLKLTLEDRFGEQVGSREFRPEEYLSSATQAKRLLSTGESANADIAIVDPGEEAVGFHINVCLQVSGGLECAG